MRLVLVLGVALAAPGFAKPSAPFEGLLSKLLAPGPLILGHHDLEHKDCLKCHTPGGGIPNSNCLACHTDIQKHVSSGQHFHGLLTADCVSCHKDHKGRNFNLLDFDEEAFKHARTGWPLQGAHAKVSCTACHTDQRAPKDSRPGETRFFGLTPSCKGCHIKDDIHFFKGKFAAKECSSCHDSVRWEDVPKFDHARETGYALLGAHAKEPCKSCHSSEKSGQVKYAWPDLKGRACLSCHKDQHGKHLSPRFRDGQCVRCHSQDAWTISSFKHDLTGFPIRGAHTRLDCVSCHKQASELLSAGPKAFDWTKTERACASCHADYHGFAGEKASRIGTLRSCQLCHNEVHWTPQAKFNHNTQTDFPLTGKHLARQCFDCHKTAQNLKLGPANTIRRYHFADLKQKTCETCHKDPHDKAFHAQFKGVPCVQCHSTTGWKDINTKRFTPGFHDKTRFPLTGRHKEQSCKTCHVVRGKEEYRFENSEKGFCVSCHKNVHDKQFHESVAERGCASCHDTTSFSKFASFRHDSVQFAITGQHKKIAQQCFDCHRVTTALLPTKPPKRAHRFMFPGGDRGFCENCHTNEHVDMFHARYAKQACTSCHTTAGFDKRLKFDHDETDFPLKYKHLEVRCSECHKSTEARFKQGGKGFKHKFLFPELEARDCASCHKDQHNGLNGPNCSSCHSERSWKRATNFHKDFSLRGVHMLLDCTECHGRDRVLKGMSRECIVCHHADDAHAGALPDCARCHTQTIWSAATFQHDSLSFPLTGAHRLADCRSCHNSGIFAGLPNDCASCHFRDAAAVRVPDHSGLPYQRCEQCHVPFSFRGAIGR